MNFDPIDWKSYNKPPYLFQWLSIGETKKFVSFDDEKLIRVEGQLYDLSNQWDIEEAKAILLDRIGKIVAEPRDGNNDELYRLLIKLRILLNTTRGNVNDIIKVIKFLYSSQSVHITPNYPAALRILHDGEQEQIDFNRILVQVIGAGIGYETRELFYFEDVVHIGESHDITLQSKFTDDFPVMENFCLTMTTNSGIFEERHSARLYRNGSIKRDGSECHRPYGNKFAYDAMKVWMRKHHFHNGKYLRDGSIKHDGMILMRV